MSLLLVKKVTGAEYSALVASGTFRPNHAYQLIDVSGEPVYYPSLHTNVGPVLPLEMMAQISGDTNSCALSILLNNTGIDINDWNLTNTANELALNCGRPLFSPGNFSAQVTPFNLTILPYYRVYIENAYRIRIAAVRGTGVASGTPSAFAGSLMLRLSFLNTTLEGGE